MSHPSELLYALSIGIVLSFAGYGNKCRDLGIAARLQTQRWAKPEQCGLGGGLGIVDLLDTT